MHNACMVTVTIRDLPDDVHACLRARAAASGKSLQQYLLAELDRLAKTPTMEEMLARIRASGPGRAGAAVAVEDIEAERSSR